MFQDLLFSMFKTQNHFRFPLCKKKERFICMSNTQIFRKRATTQMVILLKVENQGENNFNSSYVKLAIINLSSKRSNKLQEGFPATTLHVRRSAHIVKASYTPHHHAIFINHNKADKYFKKLFLDSRKLFLDAWN